MSDLFKNLLAAGIGYETASAIANAPAIKDAQHTTVSSWYDLVDFCVQRGPGILNEITGYKKPSMLGSLFEDAPKPTNTFPSESVILEKIIRWAYEIPKNPVINMNPLVLSQLFPDAPFPIKQTAWLPLIPYYCRHCHDYKVIDVISEEETLERGGYNYMIASDIYLACKSCYPDSFEGLGSLFG